ncbi:hypothetical protein AAG906_024556 [Vitis piasezkii]
MTMGPARQRPYFRLVCPDNPSRHLLQEEGGFTERILPSTLAPSGTALYSQVNPIPSNQKMTCLKESFFRQRCRKLLRVAGQHGKTTARKRTADANFAPRNKETQGRKQCLEDPRLFPTSALSSEAGPLSQPGSSIPPRGEPNPRAA